VCHAWGEAGYACKQSKSLNGKDLRVEDLDMDGSAIRGWNRVGDRSWLAEGEVNRRTHPVEVCT
jgi:hypothetical protein